MKTRREFAVPTNGNVAKIFDQALTSERTSGTSPRASTGLSLTPDGERRGVRASVEA
jgi:hypothetical protein